MYLLTAVADLAIIDLDFGKQYLPALKRLWHNMVDKKMYLTGGIGAIKQWEGFGIDYFLPQSTDEGGCYAETCAAIGVMMLAERMVQMELDREYTDVLERALYNAMLTGMAVNGKAFTYVNQMATCEGEASNRREEWFDCACCPPNVARVLGHVGGYVWTPRMEGKKKVVVDVHLFASGTLTYPVEGSDAVVKLTQESNYPWEGEIAFALEHTGSDIEVEVNVRIPSWANDDWKASFPLVVLQLTTDSYQLTPSPSTTDLKKGYLHIPSSYLRFNSSFKLHLPMKPRLIRPHPFTNQRIAVLARGPLVYCVEDVDHPWVDDHFRSLVLAPEVTGPGSLKFKEEWKEDLPLGEGYMGITLPKAGHFLKKGPLETGLDHESLKEAVDGEKEAVDLKFVPYWVRANRGGKGAMRVGIRTLD